MQKQLKLQFQYGTLIFKSNNGEVNLVGLTQMSDYCRSLGACPVNSDLFNLIVLTPPEIVISQILSQAQKFKLL